MEESDYSVLKPDANIQECQLRPVIHDCTEGQHSEILEISVTVVFTPHKSVSPRKAEWFCPKRQWLSRYQHATKSIIVIFFLLTSILDANLC